MFLTMNPGTSLTRPNRNSVLKSGVYRTNRRLVLRRSTWCDPLALSRVSGVAISMSEVTVVTFTVTVVTGTSCARNSVMSKIVTMLVECSARSTLVKQSPLVRRRWFLHMLVTLLTIPQRQMFRLTAVTRVLQLCVSSHARL